MTILKKNFVMAHWKFRHRSGELYGNGEDFSHMDGLIDDSVYERLGNSGIGLVDEAIQA